MKKFEKTWRWFGPGDPIGLDQIRQTGATGIVTALHHLPNGEAWDTSEILHRKGVLESHGLRWSVVESIPVHEDIKKRTGNWRKYVEHYKTSIKNLGKCGVQVVTYNFMPVLDWTRTDLAYRLPEGVEALRFDKRSMAAFELFILQDPTAEDRYSREEVATAADYHRNMSNQDISRVTANIIAGLPGAEEGYTLENFRQALGAYRDIGSDELRSNLIAFLEEISPVAEAEGVLLAIHPDDPPFSILGLPRVVSSFGDLEALYSKVSSPANGLCFCSGSFGARKDNDLSRIIDAFSDRIHFIHLRNVTLESDGSFFEAPHLTGSTNMYAVMKALLKEQQQRENPIPMRPDHGHRMLDDLYRDTNPGYSLIGRMKGLAELTGMETAILEAMA